LVGQGNAVFNAFATGREPFEIIGKAIGWLSLQDETS
jgi:hypothetical protein